MSTGSLSIAICLSCIAANRLVLSLRGLYYVHDHDDTTIATTNGKPLYRPRGLSQFSKGSSTLAVVSHHPEAADTAMEDETREQTV